MIRMNFTPARTNVLAVAAMATAVTCTAYAFNMHFAKELGLICVGGLIALAGNMAAPEPANPHADHLNHVEEMERIKVQHTGYMPMA